MNYCTKCASLYAKPGTCNCFAKAGVGGNDATPWIYPTFPPKPVGTGDWPGAPDGTTTTGDKITIRYENADGTQGGNVQTTLEAMREMHDRGLVSYTGEPVGI